MSRRIGLVGGSGEGRSILVDVVDGFVVDFLNDVALLDSGLSSGAVGINLIDHDAGWWRRGN